MRPATMQTRATGAATPRRGPIDPVTAIAAFAAVLLAWWLFAPVGRLPQPSARSGNSATALRLQAPAIPNGAVLDWRSEKISRWAHEEAFLHAIRGKVEPGGRSLAARPWIYTTEWLPQPMTTVLPNGEFQALLLFDANYDDRLAVVIEFEDLDTGQVIASYTYYFETQAEGEEEDGSDG